MTDPDLLVLEALGVRVGADLAATGLSREHRAEIRRSWSRSVVATADGSPADGSGPLTTVHLPSRTSALARDDSVFASSLTAQVTRTAIDARAGQLIMVHAAGVADPASGRTIALVGPSGRGKTTASTVLGRHWGYVSDETVGVEPGSLRVHPHPKPLSVMTSAANIQSTSAGGSAPKEQIGPDELGLLPAPPACRLARVVLLDRDPAHPGPPVLSPVPTVLAVAELAAELSHLTRWPAPLSAIAELLDATHGALRVRYAEADQLVALLPEMLAAQPGPASPWHRVADIGHLDLPVPAGSWQRTATAEAIADESTMTVLVDGDVRATADRRPGTKGPRAVTLDGIGPTLWRAAEQPCSLSDLAAAAVRRHGRPDDGSVEGHVSAVVTELCAHGVLVAGEA